MPVRVVAWSFVIAQFGLIAAIVLLSGDHWEVGPLLVVIGSVLVLTGLVLGIWAARWLGKGLTPLPLPNGRVDLITGGPYARVRHPMYSAVLLGMAGVALVRGSWWGVAAWVALVLLLTAKSRWEEHRLLEVFTNYAEYRERAGRFVPRVR